MVRSDIHMSKVWDVPSDKQYNTSSNVRDRNFERSWWEVQTFAKEASNVFKGIRMIVCIS